MAYLLRTRNWVENGVYFEPLEPRVLLDGSLDSAADNPLAENQASPEAEALTESSLVCETDLSPEDQSQTLIEDTSGSGETFDLLSGLPAIEGASTVDQGDADSLADPATSPPAGVEDVERSELVFVNAGIQDYELLVDDLLNRREADTQFQVVLLDPTLNGVEQVTEALAGREGIDALHFITHGDDGEVKLGSTWLDADNLAGYAAEIAQWGDALTQDADILFYACNMATEEQGRALLQSVASLTKADVAASTDLTGNPLLGGDWQLEYQAGPIETGVALSPAAQQSWQGLLDIDADRVAHWTFDADAGDSSGNGNDGTLTNGALIDTTAGTNKVGGGKLSLDGVDDYVDLTSHVSSFSGLTQGTMSAWIKTTAKDRIILESVDAADDYSGLYFRINNAGNLVFEVYENQTPLLRVKTTAIVADGSWHHVAVTVDAGGNKLYVDGVQAAVTYSTGNASSNMFFDDVTNQSSASIGRDVFSSTKTGWYFAGNIDDLRVYDRALTATEVSQAANMAPDNTVPGAQAVDEDTNLVFSSANGNPISIEEEDAGSNPVEVTLTVTNGTLTLSGTSGLTFTTGDGTADATLTFRGTVSDINNGLNGLVYTPAANYSGGDTLTLRTVDSTLVSLNIESTLKGYYTFDNTGNLGNDSSPAGAYDGTVVGAVSTVDGTRGNVLSFNAADGADYVQATGHFGNPANVTLAAWVNLTAADTGGAEVISLGDSCTLRLDDSGGLKGFIYDGSTWKPITYATTLAGTGWHHVAYTFNDAGNVHKLYLDGVEVASLAETGSISYTRGANSFIGKHGNGGTSFDYTGKIDDARVYSRALTASEISGLASDLSLIDTDSVAVTVNPVNDAPVLAGIEGTSLAYTENGAAAAVTSTITVSDADNANLTGATIQITGNYQSGQDVLSFTNTANITGIWNAEDGTLTLSGSDTVANYRAALRAVKYENTSDNPSSLTRTVSFKVNDGTAESSTLTRNIAVTQVNDLVQAANDAAAVQAGTPTEISVTANDTDGESEPVTIVELTTPAHGTATSSGGTITYTSTAGYSGPDSVQYMAFDSGAGLAHYWGLDGNANDAVGSANGTLTNTTTVAGDFGSALQFNESSSRVTIPDFAYGGDFSLSFAFKVADNTGTAFQYLYSHGTSSTNNSLSIYIGESGSSYPNVIFTNLADSNDTVSATALNIDISSLIGDGNWHAYTLTVSAIDGAKVYIDGTLQNSDTGRCKDGLNPSGSVYVGVRSDLDSARYYGGDLDTVAVFDRALSSGEISDLKSGANRATLSLTVNTPPVISLPGGALTYTENDAATVIDTGATATDTSADFNTGTLTVDYSANGSADDRLAIRNQGTGAGQIGVSGANVTYGGVTIGTFSGGSGTTPLVVTFNASSTPAAAQALMRNVTFENVSDTPSTLARTVRFVLTDGDGGTSNTATKTINVTGVNDAPVLAAIEGTALAYTENDSAVATTAAITSSDADNANLAGATVRIASNYQNGEDVLSFTNMGNITGSWNAATGTLTLSGADSVANYQAALRAVKYENTSENPSGDTRTVTFKVNDGTADSNLLTRNIEITPVDDAPVLAAIEGAPLPYTENGAATAITATITASDADNTSLSEATIQITGNYANGQDVLSFTNTANITGTWNAATGTMTLSGADTVANYQAALRAVKYQNTSENPSGLTRTVTFKVDDGTAESNPVTRDIAVTPANDAPVLAAVEGAPLAYTENGAATAITATITASDADNTSLSEATIQITGNYANGQDVLSFTNTAGITGSWNAVTGTLTLSGADTAANYQAALRAVKYENTSDNPSGAARSVTFKVSDGTAESNSVTREIAVTAVNDAPVLDLDADNSSGAGADFAAVFTENGGAVLIADVDAALSDVDSSNLQSLTVTITNLLDGASEVLAADTTDTSISAAYLNGVLTLTGADTVAHYQQVLRTVTYNNSSENPNTTARTITFVANDGTACSNVGTTTLTLAVQNDAPVLAEIEGTALAYTENGAATAITATVTASDADNTNLSGATIQITGNYQNGQDVLSFTNTAGITGSWNAVTGTLTLSGADTAANYQAALRAVKYQNTSENPSGATRTVSFKVSDGTGESNPVTRDIEVTPVNDAPALDLDANNSSGKPGADFAAAFTENGGAVLIADMDSALSDVDSPNLQSLTVTITNLLDGADEVLAADTTGTSISAAYLNGVLTLSGADTAAHYQQVLRTVTYNNTAPGDPDTTPRTITFVANDGTADSNAGTTTVTITAVDTSPQLDLDANNSSGAIGADFVTAFTEDGGAVLIADSDAVISDVDSANLQSLTVTITNLLDGASEVLAADTAGTSVNGSYLNGVLTLSGADTVAHYQQVLRTVTYNNSSESPNTTARSITFVANDGTGNGNVGTTTLAVNSVDDAPVMDLDADNSSGQGGVDFAVSFNQSGAVLVADGDATLSDVDNSNLQSLTVTITNLLDGADEVLAANTDGTSISAVYNNGVLTLSGADTLAHYQQVLRTITYDNTAAAPSTAARIVSFVANDGAKDSNHAKTIVNCPAIDLDGDDSAGRIGADFAATFTEKGGAVLIADSDATLANDASPNLQTLTVTITNLMDENKEVLSANTSGTSISASYSNGVLSLTVADTLAHYQQVLRTITYNNSSNNPNPTARTITFVANDGSTDTNIATTTLTVVALNDSPVLDLDANDSSGQAGANFATSFTENGGAVLIADSDAALSDEDSNKLQSLTVTITNLLDGTSEVLAANTAGTSINAVYNNGVLTLSGEDLVTRYQQVLRTVTYNNTSDNPNTTSRLITFAANDGDTSSNVGTTTLSVNPVNDAPVLAAVEGTALSYTENGAATTITATITASDVDNTNLAGATIQITGNYQNGQDVLSFTNTANITGIWNATTGTLTLSGSTTVDNYQAALRAVKYQNMSDNPSGLTRTVSFKVNDGTADSDAQTRDIALTVVNDAPVLAAIEGTALAYTENGAAATITATITASDVDNTNLSGATVQITGNYQNGQDVLSFTNMGNITGSWNAVTGTLTLSGADPVSNYQDALRGVKYENTSDNPSGLTRTVTFKVSDGAADSNALTRSISVTAVNDAPALDLDANNSSGQAGANFAATFTENGGAVLIADGDAALSDADSANLQSLTVTITNLLDGTSEVLAADTTGTSISASYLNGVLTLSGADTVAHYQQVLRTVTYNNSSENLDTTARSITFSANDGTADSNVGTTTLAVAAQNDAPVLAAIEGTAISYVENGAAKTITATITSSDADNANLSSASIQITGNYQNGQDVLSFTNTAGITGSWDPVTGTLTLSGADTVANYQAALRTVKYQNTSENPSGLTRTVSFKVSDGTSESNPQSRNITVTPVNDAPVLAAIEGPALAYTEGDAAAPITATITAGDADNTNFSGATIQIVGNYQNGEDELSFTNTAGITGSWNAVTGTLALSGIDTVANYQAALRAVKYENTSDLPSNLTRTVSFKVSDGTADSNLQNRSITVTQANDPPVISSIEGAALSYTENDAATAVTAEITVSDVDSANLARATIQITGNYQNGEDVLLFNDTASITGTWDAGAGTLTLSGSDTVANYQAALRSVSYQNTSDNPSGLTRTVSFTAGDGGADSNTITRAIAVTPVNDAPVITSGGGGGSADLSIAENLTAVTTVTSADPDGAVRVYSISGGADGAKFSIDASTGELTLVSAPDLENPGDSDADNVYEVTVQVSDGSGGTDTQAIAVQITDQDEFDCGGVADSDGSPDAVDENTAVGTNVGVTASASDADHTNNTVTYSLDEDAGGRFAIDSSTGVVTVAGAIDWESATAHTITVRATSEDGSFSTQDFTINVNDINENSASDQGDSSGDGTVAAESTTGQASTDMPEKGKVPPYADGFDAIGDVKPIGTLNSDNGLEPSKQTGEERPGNMSSVLQDPSSDFVPVWSADYNPKPGLLSTPPAEPGSFLTGDRPSDHQEQTVSASSATAMMQDHTKPEGKGPRDLEMKKRGEKKPSPEQAGSEPRLTIQKGPDGPGLARVEPGLPHPDRRMEHLSERARNLLTDNPMFKEMDITDQKTREEARAGETGKTITAGAAVVAGASLLGGYAIWALRGMSLLASALSSVPLWKLFDPLPILSRSKRGTARGLSGARGEDEEDDEKRLDDVLSRRHLRQKHKSRKGKKR